MFGLSREEKEPKLMVPQWLKIVTDCRDLINLFGFLLFLYAAMLIVLFRSPLRWNIFLLVIYHIYFTRRSQYFFTKI